MELLFQRKTNALANEGFVLGGMLAESGLAYALMTSGVAAGSAGGIALGVVFAGTLLLYLHFLNLDYCLAFPVAISTSLVALLHACAAEVFMLNADIIP